jgi:hypothetical protein
MTATESPPPAIETSQPVFAISRRGSVYRWCVWNDIVDVDPELPPDQAMDLDLRDPIAAGVASSKTEAIAEARAVRPNAKRVAARHAADVGRRHRVLTAAIKFAPVIIHAIWNDGALLRRAKDFYYPCVPAIRVMLACCAERGRVDICPPRHFWKHAKAMALALRLMRLNGSLDTPKRPPLTLIRGGLS